INMPEPCNSLFAFILRTREANSMSGDEIFKLGFRPRTARARRLSYVHRVITHAGKAGLRGRGRWGHISPYAPRLGMAAGVRAAAGLIGPGSRRVVVKTRYTRFFAGNLDAARAHLRYIQRDGVTREGATPDLYDATIDDVDASAFLARSQQ